MLTIAQSAFPGSNPLASSGLASSRNTPDDALIDAIADGDRHAMRLLYDRHGSQVYRFALRFVGRETTAEDVVNEVFLDVWRKADAFEHRSKVSTWLLAITRHKALEIIRRPSLETSNDDAFEAFEDPTDDPERTLWKKQTTSILRGCLKKLSPAHREIIDLVYYHGKSIDEIADVICVPPNTVKTRMFYARTHLAKLLGGAGVKTARAWS
jgi:RNA polymerase sigma-70 factor, ECF subfamily